MRSASASWELNLEGGFTLKSPSGGVVPLRSRKSEALIARLAVAEGPVSRRALVEDLWHETSPAAGLANLRQIVRHIKSALGDEWLVATRDTVAISHEIPLNIVEGPLETFMEGFSEPWCQLRRTGESSRSSDGPSPVDGFASLLDWLVQSDPIRAAEALRDHADLAQGFSTVQLERYVQTVLPAVPKDSSLFGWMLLHLAQAQSVNHDMVTAHASSRMAMQVGQIQHDADLYLEGMYFTGCLMICAGQAAQAREVGQNGLAVAEQRGLRIATGRMLHLVGTADVHLGQTHRGIKLIEQSRACFEPNEIEVAISDALRGLYHAALRERSVAEHLITQTEPIAKRLRHLRLDSIMDLARGIMMVKDGENDLARAHLARLSKDLKSKDYSPLELYAREALAVVDWRMGERADAVAQLKTARESRRKMGMGISAWDAERVAEVTDGLLRFKESKMLK